MYRYQKYLAAGIVVGIAFIAGANCGGFLFRNFGTEDYSQCKIARMGEVEASVRERFASLGWEIMDSTEPHTGSIASTYILSSVPGASQGEIVVIEVGFAAGEVAFIGCYRNFVSL